MSVLRDANWLGQQRVDVPHLRGLDSGVRADFDLLAGTMLTNRVPFVLQGFNLITLSAGAPATSLQISVANGVILHPQATEVGTIFSVASGRTVETLNATNARVTGGFTASAVNYVGVDLRRSADSTTADLVQFLNANTKTESPETVPLGRTLDYVFVIGTQDFSQTPTVAPLCKVTTDASNNIVTLEDARNMFGRLGKGGSVTTPLYTYPWPGGRTEVGNNSDFSAADKSITCLKDWMDAAMTRMWEIGGGEHWYSPTGWHNVQMVRNGATLFSSTGDYFEWTGTNLHWRELRFVFSNSTGWYNDVADQLVDASGAYGTTATNLADGDCLYVDLDRTTNRTGGTALAAIKGVTATVGSPTVPGSRVIIAWRIGSLIFTRGTAYSVGAAFQVATVGALGVVKLHQAATTPPSPIVLSDGDLNTANGVPQFDANRVLTIGAPTGGTNQTALLATGLGTGNGIQGTGGATNGKGVFGQGGGTTGIGIQGFGASNAGVGSGVGGNFQGGTNSGTSGETGTSGAGVVAAGPSSGYGPGVVIKQSATTNIAAQLRAQRSDSAPMTTIDYLGFRSGWIYEKQFFTEMPTVSNTSTTTQNWAIGATAAGHAGWNSPLNAVGGAWPGGSIGLSLSNTRVNADLVYLSSPAFYNMSNNATFDPSGLLNQQIWVFEHVFAFESTMVSTDYWIGWSNTTAGTQPWSSGTTVCAGIRFKQSAGAPGPDTQLQLMSGDGTTQTSVSLGITPALDTRYRIRFELHRSGSPYGACIRVFVNGVLTTKTTNLPITATLGGDMQFQWIVVSTATSATTPGVAMGPIRVNGYLANGGVLTAGPTTSDV